MTIPRVLDLLALREDVNRQQAYDQGIAVSRAIAFAFGENSKVLEELLGPEIPMSEAELMATVPIPEGYFEELHRA
jgi:hypothetical protein